MSGRRRRRCGICPKWGKGWCIHRAEMRSPNAPACDFGLHEMTKKYFRDYFAERRKQKTEKKGIFTDD